MGETVIVAGIGCRRGAEAADVLGAVQAALAAHDLGSARLVRLATSAAKATEPGIAAAARSLGLDLAGIAEEALAAVADRTLTRSERSLQATALPSLSEAAALASAGNGARLLGPRVAFGGATCALAETAQ